jgi:hypothetical protein
MERFRQEDADYIAARGFAYHVAGAVKTGARPFECFCMCSCVYFCCRFFLLPPGSHHNTQFAIVTPWEEHFVLVAVGVTHPVFCLIRTRQLRSAHPHLPPVSHLLSQPAGLHHAAGHQLTHFPPSLVNYTLSAGENLSGTQMAMPLTLKGAVPPSQMMGATVAVVGTEVNQEVCSREILELRAYMLKCNEMIS